MYGNTLLPGVTAGASYRNDGSIWRGYTEATWFQTVKVSGEGEEATKIPLGTILIQNLTDGTYTPLTESGIVISASGLPGSRLGIAADTTGTSGTATTEDDETVKTNSTLLIGIMGVVDQARLLIGDKKFEELTEAQQTCLRAQLEAWNFQLVSVLQA